jgi:hypothetical protein
MIMQIDDIMLEITAMDHDVPSDRYYDYDSRNWRKLLVLDFLDGLQS